MYNNALTDVWRDFIPDQFVFTWKKLNPLPVFCRLDYVLVTAQMVIFTDILPGFHSDHSIPIISLKFSEGSHGPGYWKLNVSRVMLRYRATWVDKGEKPSKYFANLEKRRHNERVIKTLKLDDNTIINTQKAILDEQVRFFGILYESRQEHLSPIPNYLESVQFPTLTEDERLMFEEPIAKEEIIEAIRALHNNKTPGLDGIAIEFYKALLLELITVLHQLFTEIMETHVMDF